MKLLSTNTKLAKMAGGQFLVAGLALAPHKIASDVTLCENSTPGCRSACNLWFAGRTVTASVREAMIRRARMLLDSPVEFYSQLVREIRQHERKAQKRGMMPLVRLNVASDLDWAPIIAQFPNVTFYDYTAVVSRAMNNPLPNYHLTVSRKENSSDERLAAYLAQGGNVAVVFNVEYVPSHHKLGKLPKSYLGAKVIDGDKHDFRIPQMDGRGVVVGLRLKGGTKARANAIRTGFAVTL